MSNAQDPWHHLWDLHGEPKSCTSRDANRLKNVATRIGEATPIQVTTQTGRPASQPAHGTGNPYGVRRKPAHRRRDLYRRDHTHTYHDANGCASVVIRTRDGESIQVTTRTDPFASQSACRMENPYGLRRKQVGQRRNLYRRRDSRTNHDADGRSRVAIRKREQQGHTNCDVRNGESHPRMAHDKGHHNPNQNQRPADRSLFHTGTNALS